jgi:hypothetical protein
MKNLLTMVIALLVSAVAVDAQRIPLPTSARFRITCRVAEKAEWWSGNRAIVQLPDLQIDDASSAFAVDSQQAPDESTVEVAAAGIFRNGNFPIDIITVTQPADPIRPVSRTITVCWKI